MGHVHYGTVLYCTVVVYSIYTVHVPVATGTGM